MWCILITLLQVTGNGALSGSFKIYYQSNVTFTCTFSCSNDSPSTFNYTIEGDNPSHYTINPLKPAIRYVGDVTKVSFSIACQPKYHFDIRNNTQELAYIGDVSAGNWDPALPTEIPIFESVSGTVLFKM